MLRHALIFLGCFAAAALVVVVVRSAVHDPYAAAQPAPGAPVVVAPAPAAPAPVAAAAPEAGKTVNTICPLCAMEVDPVIPPAIWQGKRIGFGCRACPPRFAADPDRYGPFALRNAVATE
jgi:hypothetical protein